MHIQRNTKQRQLILDEIRKMKTHPTASELFEVVHPKLPKLSISTVYRTLQVLSEIGLVQKLETNGTEARFDGDVSKHFHVRCLRCGKIEDATDLPDNLLNHHFAWINGYRIVSETLNFSGICPTCQVRSENETKG